MKAVIMAGGKGTRLRSVSEELPKPMVPVLGKPILEYQIENLKALGIKDIRLIVGYKSEPIKNYFGDGSSFGVNISYIDEETPLGTAGALYYLKDEKEDFLLIMGDLMLSVDFRRFMDFHKKMGGLATLFTHPNSHPYDSDLIVTKTVFRPEDYREELYGLERLRNKEGAFKAELDIDKLRSESLVLGVLGKKDERPAYYHNLVNSGIYALSPKALSLITEPKKTDLDKELIRPLIERAEVYSYHSTEYVKDMGTPERYEQVAVDLKEGIVSGKNLIHKQPAVFLDRDGTINVFKGFMRDIEDFELIDGACEALKQLNSSRFLSIVVTNQPVIARGDLSLAGLDEIHKKMERLLGEGGAYADGIYFCPHHKDSGFEGEIPELKFVCGCRKPEIGMIRLAELKYNIDLSRSFMVGDMTMDIECGKRAGLKTVLLKTGAKGEDGVWDSKPDHVCEDIREAVELILSLQAK